jgi:hypothetical protein
MCRWMTGANIRVRPQLYRGPNPIAAARRVYRDPSGIVKLIVVPTPGVLSALIVPPCA